MLTPADVALLQDACRDGEVKVKIAGRMTKADEAREFERLKSATVLQYLRFLEPLPDRDAFARWRPVAGCQTALGRVLEPQSDAPSPGRRARSIGG
jgi:hypothetical protein